MKNLSILLSLLFLTENVIAEERVVLYNNYGYIFSEKSEIVNNKLLLTVPNSVVNDSLNVEVKYQHKNIPIINKTILNSNINTLLFKNIGKEITFDNFNKTYSGIVDSVQGNFLILYKNNKKSYFRINSLTNIQFEKNIDFSNKLFDISLQNNENKEVKVSYSGKFQNVSWKPIYKLYLLNDKVSYLDYDININNNSSYSFKNINLELLSGDIQQANNGRYLMKTSAHLEDSRQESFSNSNFNDFSNYQKLVFENPVSLLPFSSTNIPYFDNKEINYEEFLILEDNPNSNFNNKNPNIEISLIRDENSEFPISAGNIEVYEGENIYSSTFIGANHLNNKSKNENIKFSIGKSQNVYANKTSNYKNHKFLNRNRNKNQNITLSYVNLDIYNDSSKNKTFVYKINNNSIIIKESVLKSGIGIQEIADKYFLDYKSKEKTQKIFSLKPNSKINDKFIIVSI